MLTGAGGFGSKNLLGTIVYGLVGLSAVYQALAFKAARSRQPVAA
jgi:uncharacterized membrane protein YuzA (DUF378 family)